MSSKEFEQISATLDQGKITKPSEVGILSTMLVTQNISNLFNELANAIAHGRANPLVDPAELYGVVSQGVEHLRPHLDSLPDGS